MFTQKTFKLKKDNFIKEQLFTIIDEEDRGFSLWHDGNANKRFKESKFMGRFDTYKEANKAAKDFV